MADLRDNWRVLIAETLTGRVRAEVASKDLPAFTRQLDDKGSWTVNVLPDDPGNAGLDLHTYSEPGRYSWVIFYGVTPLQGGPVWTYSYDESTRTLAVSGTGMEGILDRRVLRNPAGNPAVITGADNDLTFTNRSLHDIAALIMYQIYTPESYPVTVTVNTGAVTTGTASRTYFGYDLSTAWQRLTELSNVDGGPEFTIHIQPGTFPLRWVADIGNPYLFSNTPTWDPTQLVWDYGAAIGYIHVDVNGSSADCSRVWVKGSGSERTLLTGYADDATVRSNGMPLIEYIDNNFTSSTDLTALGAWATADLKRLKVPTETWQCAADIDGRDPTGRQLSPSVASIVSYVGYPVTVGVQSHPWIPDGQYTRRLLGYSNNNDHTVNLVLETPPVT